MRVLTVARGRREPGADYIDWREEHGGAGRAGAREREWRGVWTGYWAAEGSDGDWA